MTGDTAIFSSKIIPGNERTIADLHNRLIRSGVEVITEKDAGVHVSGHPCRDELRRMYQWIRPQIAVPVHGEARHMQAHGALARALQVPQPVLVENGDLLRLAPGPATVVGRAPSGRLALDGDKIVATDHVSIGARRKLMHNGAVFVSVIVDRGGRTLVRAPHIRQRCPGRRGRASRRATRWRRPWRTRWTACRGRRLATRRHCTRRRGVRSGARCARATASAR